MKFSVAPESSNAGVSALFLKVCKKTRIDIDWRLDKYTCSELSDLIKAILIRLPETPVDL